MSQFFQFEADFIESLRCIPMQVRLKLDTCGIKLKLAQWNHLTHDDRQQLVDLPCENPLDIQHYRMTLQQMIWQRTHTEVVDLAVDPTPAWLDSQSIPASVQQKAAALQVPMTPTMWADLSPLQRFALIKLSRSGHENSNFLPALQEFQILSQ